VLSDARFLHAKTVGVLCLTNIIYEHVIKIAPWKQRLSWSPMFVLFAVVITVVIK